MRSILSALFMAAVVGSVSPNAAWAQSAGAARLGFSPEPVARSAPPPRAAAYTDHRVAGGVVGAVLALSLFLVANAAGGNDSAPTSGLNVVVVGVGFIGVGAIIGSLFPKGQ